MRMWAGSLIRVTPSFVQVMVALAESAVQYSQITDCSTMLWTPLLFWKRTSGRGVMVSWALAAKVRGRKSGEERKKGRKEERKKEGRGMKNREQKRWSGREQ